MRMGKLGPCRPMLTGAAGGAGNRFSAIFSGLETTFSSSAASFTGTHLNCAGVASVGNESGRDDRLDAALLGDGEGGGGVCDSEGRLAGGKKSRSHAGVSEPSPWKPPGSLCRRAARRRF